MRRQSVPGHLSALGEWPGGEASSLCDMSLDLFQSIGLSEAKAKETLKNVTVSATLESIIRKVRKHCHDCVIFVSTCRDSLSG